MAKQLPTTALCCFLKKCTCDGYVKINVHLIATPSKFTVVHTVCVRSCRMYCSERLSIHGQCTLSKERIVSSQIFRREFSDTSVNRPLLVYLSVSLIFHHPLKKAWVELFAQYFLYNYLFLFGQSVLHLPKKSNINLRPQKNRKRISSFLALFKKKKQPLCKPNPFKQNLTIRT